VRFCGLVGGGISFAAADSQVGCGHVGGHDIFRLGVHGLLLVGVIAHKHRGLWFGVLLAGGVVKI